MAERKKSLLRDLVEGVISIPFGGVLDLVAYQGIKTSISGYSSRHAIGRQDQIVIGIVSGIGALIGISFILYGGIKIYKYLRSR